MFEFTKKSCCLNHHLPAHLLFPKFNEFTKIKSKIMKGLVYPFKNLTDVHTRGFRIFRKANLGQASGNSTDEPCLHVCLACKSRRNDKKKNETCFHRESEILIGICYVFFFFFISTNITAKLTSTQLRYFRHQIYFCG